MRKTLLFLVKLIVLVAFITGCDNGKINDIDKTPKRESKKEEIPEINYTEDSPRFRNRKLTEHFTVNDSPILYGFYNLYNFEVVKVNDKEYPYRMFFFGESHKESKYLGYDSIYLARGRSLAEWEVYCGNGNWDDTMDVPKWEPVMTRDSEPYDSIHNGDPSVVYKDGNYYMVFSSVGFDNRDGITYIVNCVMGAISKDGINWTKTEGPILIWDKEYEEGWDAREPHPPSMGGYHRPSLIWDEEEDKWKIWFDYFLPGTFVSMGYAVNNGEFMDPTHWQVLHADENPQLRDWPNPEIVKINNRYYSFSDCTGFGTALGPQNDRQIVMAYSTNGYEWKVIGRILPEDKMYGTHLPQTFVEEVNGEKILYIFYSMVVEEDLPRYSKANFMHIKVEDLERLADSY